MSEGSHLNLITSNRHEKFDYSEVEKCIKNIIKNEGFVNYNIKENIHPPNRGSFLGTYIDINIKGETNTEKKEINLFFKVIVKDETTTLLSLIDVYQKELFVYLELSQICKKLQDEICLPEDKRFKIIKSYNESTPNVIIMENMAVKGYRANISMDCMTLEFAELAFKEIAKFHALSFVLEVKRPEYFENKIKSLKSALIFNDDFKGFIKNMCELTRALLDGDSRRKFDKVSPNFIEKFSKQLTSKCGRDVLCHGDYRPNNILQQEIDGEIKDLIPIDYQLIYYGCPVLDLLYLVFIATDRNFRKSNLPYLYDVYYETLRTFLAYFDLDVVNVYPKKEFERHLTENLDYGLIKAVISMPIFMCAKEETPDITKGAMAEINFNLKSEEFQVRMIELVEDFIEWGYL